MRLSLESGTLQEYNLLNEEILSLNVNYKTILSSGFDCDIIYKLITNMRLYHPSIYQHSLNVSHLATSLACKMGLTSEEIYRICIGALLHDIGKLSIPRFILEKKYRLTDNEWTVMKNHPIIGIKLLSQYPWAKPLEPLILLHHERLDGKGYYSYTAENIPLAVRIITLADAFDAMASRRPYQYQKNFNDCWMEINRCSGTQFDPDLLPYFYIVTSNHLYESPIKI